ncbi:hypothetical protein C7S14_2867 [Burkholderia cepacia]|nr:hypothetical protein C7S14_2867 [Burkholderia cepacia]
MAKPVRLAAPEHSHRHRVLTASRGVDARHGKIPVSSRPLVPPPEACAGRYPMHRPAVIILISLHLSSRDA